MAIFYTEPGSYFITRPGKYFEQAAQAGNGASVGMRACLPGGVCSYGYSVPGVWQLPGPTYIKEMTYGTGNKDVRLTFHP